MVAYIQSNNIDTMTKTTADKKYFIFNSFWGKFLYYSWRLTALLFKLTFRILKFSTKTIIFVMAYLLSGMDEYNEDMKNKMSFITRTFGY